MKKWLYIVVLGFLFSCAGENKRENVKAVDMEMDEEVSLSRDEIYTGILKQKLQEKMELISLGKLHPEFDLPKKDTTIFKSTLSATTHLEEIKILHQKTMGDTLFFKLQLVFKDVNHSNIDTIQAKIISEKVRLGGEEITSSEIYFESISVSGSNKPD
ncbi:MAG: hypothetical protein WBG90_21710 [Saonia sp.]